MKIKAALFSALLIASATPAAAQSVTGTLSFVTPGGTNYFNPANGFVPAGYGNSAGTTVAIGAGTEFGFADSANTDTADFTATGLTITDVVNSSAAPFFMTFTSSTPGLFSNLSLLSSSFGAGSTFSVNGNTLSFNSVGAGSPGTQRAVFSFGEAPTVPEPATWAMMLVGFGAAGYSLRCKAKVAALQAA